MQRNRRNTQKKPSGLAGVLEAIAEDFGVPVPKDLLGEFQRLNKNMEALKPSIDVLARHAPTLASLADALKGMQSSDLKVLATALNGADLPKAVAVMERFTNLAEGLVNKLQS